MSYKIDANCVGAFFMARRLIVDRTYLKQPGVPETENGVIDPKIVAAGTGMKVDPQGCPLGQVSELNAIDKRMFCVSGFSTDGYCRIYKVREDQLEIVAQVNLQDKILATKPLYTHSLTDPENDKER